MKNNNKEKEILQITQIKIVLPGKTVELSSEEAKKVFKELAKLFNIEEELFTKKKEYIPYPYPPAPIYIDEKPDWPTNPPWIITCDSNTTSQFGISNENVCLSINLNNKTQ